MYGLVTKQLIKKQKPLEPWPFFQKLVEQHSLFSHLEYFFARRLLKDSLGTIFEEVALCIAYVFALSIQGHSCVIFNENNIFPDVENLFLSQNTMPIKEKDDIKRLLIKKMLNGFKNLPEEIFEKIFSINQEFPNKPLCLFENKLYLQKCYVYETQVIKHVKRLYKTGLIHDDQETDIDVNVCLLPEQKKAVLSVVNNRITIICGGPGTGKTFTASNIVKVLSSINMKKSRPYRIIVSAPTGKATFHLYAQIEKGLQENVNISGMTLHALLQMKKGKTKKFSEDLSGIDVDLLIIDEASMIDMRMMAYLLESINEKAKVVFIGDPDQLPPIEMGSVFPEMQKCDTIFPVCHLQRSMRFKNEGLVLLAKAINEKKVEDTFSILENETIKNSSFISLEKEALCKEWIYKEAEKAFFVPQKEPFDPKKCLEKLKQFRILSCMRQGPWGVEAINKKIFSLLHSDTEIGDWWAIPIMITRNYYHLELYNGMMGMAMGQFNEKKSLFTTDGTGYFLSEDNLIQSYPLFALPSYEYGYCLSVHKSQGSEFRNIALLAPVGSEVFGKEILYTAVTRAKEKIKIIGQKSTIEKSLQSLPCQNQSFYSRLKKEI